MKNIIFLGLISFLWISVLKWYTQSFRSIWFPLLVRHLQLWESLKVLQRAQLVYLRCSAAM